MPPAQADQARNKNRPFRKLARSVAGLLSLLSLAGADDVVPHLVFSHKIGRDWKAGANSGWMNYVAISSDGLTIGANGNVPGGKPGEVGLWTFPSGKYVRAISSEPLAISRDFRYLATETGILELQANKWKFRISSPAGRLVRAAFSPTGQYVALLGAGKIGRGQITVLRTLDGSVSTSFGKRYAASLAFAPDNETLASGHWSNVTLWDARSGERLALLPIPKRSVDPNAYDRVGAYIYGIGFSNDGKFLAAGTDDGELQIWDVGSRRLLHSLKIGYGDVSNPAFSPNGTLVAAGTYADGTLSLVEVASGKIVSHIQVSMFGCGSVAFSPDGQYIAVPSNGGQLARGRFDDGGTIRVFRVAK